MFAFGGKADIGSARVNIRFWLKADIGRTSIADSPESELSGFLDAYDDNLNALAKVAVQSWRRQ